MVTLFVHSFLSCFDVLCFTSSFQDEIARLQELHQANQKKKQEIEAENAKLAKPLQKAEEEVNKLQRELQSYDKVRCNVKLSLPFHIVWVHRRLHILVASSLFGSL